MKGIYILSFGQVSVYSSLKNSNSLTSLMETLERDDYYPQIIRGSRDNNN